MSFPEQWNSVRCACFARLSLTGSSPASLLLKHAVADTEQPDATI